jgi:putative ABC transport system substrate-binding protein
MRSRLVPLVLSAVLFVFSIKAEAQQAGKIVKIGWLSSGSSSAPASVSQLDRFRRQLSELGYIEGKSIAIEYRFAGDNFERLPTIVDELANLRVDVLVTVSTPVALAAKNATKTIPVIFLGVSDPVGAGLVDSLARPGGNITGFTNIGSVLAGKRLELLREINSKLPKLPYCGIHIIPALQSNGKKANWRHENWVCRFILWRLAAPRNMRARLMRQSRPVVPR